jgi:PKD repeat protein
VEENIRIVSIKRAAFFVLFWGLGLSVFGQCSNLNVSVGPDIEACNGATLTLNATYSGGPTSGAPIYQWSFNINGGSGGSLDIPGAIFSSYTITNFNSSNIGTYTCTVIFPNEINCDDSNSVNVNFPSNSNFSLDAGNNITICQGTTATINASLSNVPDGALVTYLWTSNTGGYSSTSATPSFNNLPVGNYTFTGVASANGCVDPDQVNVTVNAVPATPSFSIPAIGCPGAIIPIEGFAPVPGLIYNWSPAVNNGNSSSPSINTPNSGTTSYSVTATNSTTGCTSPSFSQSISVTQVSVANPINVQVGSNILTGSSFGNIVTYTICGNSSGANTAQINYGIASGDNASYSIAVGTQTPTPLITGLNTIPIVLSIGNNFFTITATVNGCVVSRTFNIYAGSNPYVAGGVSNSIGLCNGQIVDITISSINPGTNTPNAAGTTYTLTFSDNSSPIVNTDIPNNLTVSHTFSSSSCGQPQTGLFPANAYYATIVASNACGTTTTSVSPMVVSEAPVAGFNLSDSTICVNSTVTITNTGIAGNAIAGNNNTAPFICSGSGPFYYTISPATGWNVTTGSIGQQGFTIDDWGNIIAATNSIVVNFIVPGTYTITQRYLNGCGLSIAQKTICVAAPPVCAFTANPNNSCTPLVTNITNNTTGPSCGNTPLALSYQWSVTNPTGGTSSVNTTISSVNPTITLNNNTVAPNLASLNYPINVIVNPLIPGSTTPIPNCSSTCNQIVTVYPQPSFITQPTQPADICIGGNFNPISVVVSYLGPGTPDYQWYSNTTASSSNGTLIPNATFSSYTPAAIAVGTIYYYCVVTFPASTFCNSITSNNVPAIVVPDPVASATPTTQTICLGGTVPVAFTGTYTTGTGAATHQWNTIINGVPSPISGATASTYTPPAFTSTGTFNYTVTINTSGSGCTASTSPQIAVVVIPDPTISVQPITVQTLCQNAPPTELTVTAIGGFGTLVYQWYSNTVNNNTTGTLIAGANGPTYAPSTAATGTVYYYCIITTSASGCSVTSATSAVIVNPAPTFTTQPAASNVCVGGTTNQMCVQYTNGTGLPSYQWFSNTANNTTNGTVIPGATNDCYTPTSTSAGTTYFYAVINLTGGGCSSITSNTAAVVIAPDPVIAIQPITTQDFCVGGSSAPLSVTIQAATGIGAFTYQWYSNTSATNSGGTIIPSATAATFNPPIFTTAGTFYYYCIVTDAGNGCGTVASQAASVIVVNDPTVNAEPVITQTLCQGAAPTLLTVSASGGTGVLLYQWYSNTANNNTGGTLIPSANGPTFTPSTATTGTLYYYCIISTAASGCSVTSATSTVIVSPEPTFTTQPAASNVCVGGTPNQMCVEYTNGTGNPTYQWFSNTADNSTNGTVIPGATISCYTPPSAPAGTTYYYAVINLSGGGCSSITSNTAAVVFTPDPIIASQPIATQIFCVGGSSTPLTVTIQPTTGIGAFSYQWYSNTSATNSGGTIISSATSASYIPPVFTSTGTFYYYCIVTDAGNGCGTVASQAATITVVNVPIVNSNPIITQTLCQGATPALLSVTASGGTGTLLYQWYSNTANNNTSGTLIFAANGETYSPPTTATGTLYYYCIITTAASGCSVTSATSEVIVTPAPTFTTQPAANNVCVGGITNQMCVEYINGTGTPTYQWFSNTANNTSNGTAILGATTSCYTPPSASAGTTYYYAVINLTGGGCSSITSNTGELIVNSTTSISTQPTPSQTICVGGTLATPLSVTYSGGAGTPAYQWYESASNNPVIGATSSTFSPPIFTNTGTWSYYVTVTLAGAGCGIQTSDIANIIVVEDPTATISPGGTYCQNAATVNDLSVSASDGQGTFSYQWYSNTTGGNASGSLISGATSVSFTPSTTDIGSAYYYCVVTQTGANCSVNSPTAEIIVTPAPTFITQPTATQALCIGGTTTQLNVAYNNGTGTATYQWYSNTSNTYSGGILITGQTLSSFTPSSTIPETTYYYCIISFSASGGCSMITSNIAEVVVVPFPTISSQPVDTQTICVGGTIQTPLSVAYSDGAGTPTYQWFSTPASSISGASNSSYTPPVYNNAATFNYFATISLSGSGCGSLTSANGTVIVIADPIVSVQPTTTQSVCQNAITSQLSVSITGGNGSATYQWFSNTTDSNSGGTVIAGATNNTFTPPSSVVGTQYYYCMISQTGTNCGVTSNTATVVVNLAPAIATQPIASQQICLNAPTSILQIVYSNGSGQPDYQWYANTINSVVGGTQINTATNNTFTPPSNVDGTFYYYCVISFLSGGGCPSITSNVAQVIVHPYPIVTISGGETICLLESSDVNFAFTPSVGLYDIAYTVNGQSAILENYNGATPIFTVNPSETTTYVFGNIAYDQVPQCAIQPNTSITVVVNPLPALNNSVYTFCSDVATTSLQYNPDANSYTYNWLANSSANYPGQANGPSAINITLPNPSGDAPTNFYYVTNLINNATGCQALDSILVTINPNPVGSFTFPANGCEDTPIALSNGDATIGNYQWFIDGQLYSTQASPAPPIFNSFGNYTLEMIATNTYGCTDTLNSIIQIYDQPVSNFSTDISNGCAPLPVNFTNLSTGSFITSYDWTFAPDSVSWDNTYSSSILNNPPTVTYQQGEVTTFYDVTLAVTNACGTISSSQTISVLPSPDANFTLATNTICSGGTLMVNNISVGEPTSYIWNYGNFTSFNPNLISMFFPSDSVAQVYPITLTLTNACGTDTYIDSVTVLPDNVNGGFTTTVEAGCSPLTVTLTNTTFNTNLSATWYLDDPLNTVIVNQNSVQFTYLATNNITQIYNPYLVVTDGCASDTIVTNLNVFANPLPIISTSQTNLCAGTTIDFIGSITGGDTGFGYEWDFGGLGSSTTSSSSFTFPSGSQIGDAIQITLTATSPTFSATNCSNTTSTTIYVYENPSIDQIAFSTTEGCSELEVSVANLPSATNQINWGDGTTNFNNSHIYSNNGPSLLANNVTVTSTNTYPTIPVLNCSTIANQIITVYPAPLPELFSSAVNVCEGGSVDFIASTTNNQNTGISYLWNFGTQGTSTNANTSVTFSNGDSTGLQTPVQLTAFQNTSGTICATTISEDVFVYDTPDLSTALFSDVNGCSPLLVSITNLPTSTYTYNWGDGTTTTNPNHVYINQGTAPLNYNITIDATTFYPTLPLLSCNSATNQIVQANPQPFAAFSLNPSEGCFYNPVSTTLENTSVNALAPYVWIYDGTTYTTNSINYIATFTTPGTHPIELIVSNQFGCTDSVSNDFVIYDLPTVTLNTIDDALCLGATTEFEIDGTGISTSSWDFGDGITLNLLNPTSLVHYYNQPGVYSVTAIVTNIYGCSDTITFPNEVIIYPRPTASFTTNTTIADIVYPYFEFYDNSAGAINYYWNFGDSNWSNDVNPTHTYNTEGNYLVELTVTNEYNCFDIAYQIVQVEGIVVYIPNAFTPLDYNGVNDVFKPTFSSTEGIEFYEMIIYNRWGAKIFQTNSIDEAWIGNSQENDPGDDNYYAQNDTYIYTVRYRKKARAYDPQPDQIITGHVTIIR